MPGQPISPNPPSLHFAAIDFETADCGRSSRCFACQTIAGQYPPWYSCPDTVETNMPVPDPLITTSPDRLGGTPVFAETRVPVQTLVDYLEAGDALDDFLADFPSVSREHAVAVLELAKSALLDKAVGA